MMLIKCIVLSNYPVVSDEYSITVQLLISPWLVQACSVHILHAQRLLNLAESIVLLFSSGDSKEVDIIFLSQVCDILCGHHRLILARLECHLWWKVSLDGLIEHLRSFAIWVCFVKLWDGHLWVGYLQEDLLLLRLCDTIARVRLTLRQGLALTCVRAADTFWRFLVVALSICCQVLDELAADKRPGLQKCLTRE